MADKPRLAPSATHPITITPNAHRVLVRVEGHVVADSSRALTLQESTYPPVQYIPREDVDFTVLERTDHATYCPYKGDCAYYSVRIGDHLVSNAVWTYEQPYGAVAVIKDHVAFYLNHAELTELQPAARPGGRD